MRKEVLFAILAGVVVGAVLAFGIWRANSALKENDSESPSPTETIEPTITDEEFGITLSKPEELDVVGQSPINISGITRKSTWVTISSEEEDYIIKSDSVGAFEQEVELVGGINQILITAFDSNGNSTDEKLTLVFSTEFERDEEDVQGSEEASEEATDEAGQVSDVVAQKLTEAKNKPKAYLGTIADIVENTIQITSVNDEIQQLKVADNTSFVKITTTTKVVDFDDVAIGDFIVAMGFVAESEVLEARRVLITSEPDLPVRLAIMGTVRQADKGELTVTELFSEEEYTVETTSSVIVTEPGEEISEIDFSDIEEGSVIIVVGAVEDEALEARRIHVISSPEPSPSEE